MVLNTLSGKYGVSRLTDGRLLSSAGVGVRVFDNGRWVRDPELNSANLLEAKPVSDVEIRSLIAAGTLSEKPSR